MNNYKIIDKLELSDKQKKQYKILISFELITNIHVWLINGLSFILYYIFTLLIFVCDKAIDMCHWVFDYNIPMITLMSKKQRKIFKIALKQYINGGGEV